MERAIVEYLEREHGVRAPREYYGRIDEWRAWWQGYYRPFHEFSECGAGGYPIKRELFRLNMAKKVCEDWASLLLTEKTSIYAADTETSRFLSGDDGAHGFLESSSFMREAVRLTERAFALGTGAAIVRLSGVNHDRGRLIPTPSAKITFDFVDASHIVPITVRRGRITEAAFVSEIRRGGEDLIYIELHRMGEDGYVIENELCTLENGELKRREGDGSVAGVVHTGSMIPLFSILTPNLSNHIDGRCGMGISVFADAVDCLKGVDLAFNNFCRDIKLGGKKVFLNQSLIMRDEAGNRYTPDDVAQQLFVTIGDGDLAENTLISEHNPALRTDENADAVQHQLDYLSFRCGLGTRHYLFSGVQGKAQLTATQYTGELQDMIQNTAKHRLNAEEFVRGAIRGVLWAAREILLLPVDPDCELTVTFDDGYFTDAETLRERDRLEVAAGLMLPYEYRMKWKGESEEIARARCAEAAEQN